MQQYSSLPEQNSQIDATPKLLTTIQQLRAELWLESSLNKLQSHLNDCLLAACTTVPQPEAIETAVFQTLVNDLNSALHTSQVALALFQPQATVGKVCCISTVSGRSPCPTIEVTDKTGKKLRWRSPDSIELENLQDLANQEPPSAWQFANDVGDVMGWLIISNAPQGDDCELLPASQPQWRSQLVSRAVKQLTVALAQLRQIQFLLQKSQNLSQSNQELERTNQLKNQFLANTSHEIRTPLSSILGFTHLLLAQGYDPSRERHQEYLNIIQSSGKHLLGLINDILDLSKIEANQLEVQWETVNLPKLCNNVLALVKEKAANKGLKLLLDLDANVTNIVADPLRLKQMLLNLLFNALKFTTTGSVGLKVFIKGIFVHFKVWDTGTGISPEDQTKLFQPYFQITHSAANPQEGTGLGLVVTQKLAEAHGGCVKVESEVARGSSFTIILPLAPIGEPWQDQNCQEIPPEGSSFPPPIITPNTNREILLVEDDLPNGQLMQIYLSKLGYQVTWVNNTTQMWTSLQHLQPAVILMDVSLPDGSGLSLVQQLREHQHYHKIPIIAQTAMAMKGDREICLAAGINEYISKPIDLPLLANLVAKYSQP
jgi:signal transduction histidine kinase/CheY-like chemotaxis protein